VSIASAPTRDGQARLTEDDDTLTKALAGRWAIASDGLELALSFDRVAFHTCEVPEDQPAGSIATEVRCFTTPVNSKLPSAALICALDPNDVVLDDAALLGVRQPPRGLLGVRTARPRLRAALTRSQQRKLRCVELRADRVLDDVQPPLAGRGLEP
jgi:hypothetical protein